jgi:hypothetical protein
MPPVKPNNKPNTGVPGVKMLITAASLAATVGGWALISAKETQPVQPVPSAASAQIVAPVLSIKLAPLPTLVPPGQAQIITVSNPRAAAAAPQPAAAAPQTAPQPAPQPALVLRDVSAPAASASAPAPATKTHSSR